MKSKLTEFTNPYVLRDANNWIEQKADTDKLFEVKNIAMGQNSILIHYVDQYCFITKGD